VTWRFPTRGRAAPVGSFLEHDAELGVWTLLLADGRIGWYTDRRGRPHRLIAETRDAPQAWRDDERTKPRRA
jgi:hypothetical protein